MSTQASNAEEDIPLESRHPPKVPDPGTENRNNNLPPGAIVRDVRADAEHIPGMVRESTVWDVYNNEARKVDNELVKDWTASLNFLLVFAAIFAAVLTAFIIESKKMLEQDPTEILVDITIQYFNSIGNQTRNNFSRPDFEPSFEAISINCLLFASLGASLVAALASVVALQWVADYDAAITRGGSSPEDRAKRRQFRYAGVIGWKMGEIIATLPILLYSSVILFWAGAIQWMWMLHHTVGYVVAGGTAIAVLFYASTTILAAVYVSAPFRTPLSRGLYWAMGPSASTIFRGISCFPFNKILRRVALLFRDARFPSYFRGSAVFQWIKMHSLPGHTSRYREDKASEQDSSVPSDALDWLAQQLPISGDQHERLLLCASGILTLSTEKPPSPRFHDAPWLAILEILSKHFMHQILSPTSPEKDYQGVGILLHCINTPFIGGKVVPDASYIRDPREAKYWTQHCLVKDGTLDLEAIGPAPMAFLLARDVPTPSLGSDSELEATWKLIKKRNSIGSRNSGLVLQPGSEDIWREIFSDIGRYSPEFLESCLCHFRTWTNIFRHISFERQDYTAMFDSIVEQSLHRDLTTGEVLALVRAFASYLIASQWSGFSETVDETNIIPLPLTYALAVMRSPESTRVTHLAITLLVVRAARLAGTEPLKWARWITLMLWIAVQKEDRRWSAMLRGIRYLKHEGTWQVWDEIEMSSTRVAAWGPHIEEIARTLWRVDNSVMGELTRDAVKDPQSLRYLELLLQWIPYCYGHHMGSQHILLHLYQCALADSYGPFYAMFHTGPVGIESVYCTTRSFNLILAMLALSDTQDLACLRFRGEVGLECAGRILEIINAVKRQPTAFLGLITDILTSDSFYRAEEQVVVLEVIKQAMAFMDEESTAAFLCPLASSLRASGWHGGYLADTFVAETQRMIGFLQARYAASWISSTTQLRVLSCVRSAAVTQPAMGRFRMHEPL